MRARVEEAGLHTREWRDEVLRETAAKCMEQLDELVGECVRYIQSEMPELENDEELADGLIDSATDNFRTIFKMIVEGMPVALANAPPGAIAYAEIMVRRGTPLSELLRAYRLGTMWFWSLWRRELSRQITETDLLMQTVDEAMSFLFGYVDLVSMEVTEEYALQRERWARSAAALRHETVLAVLEGGPVDPQTAGRRLGYELRRAHVGFVLWSKPQHESEHVMVKLEQAAAQLAAQLGCSRPLLVPDGRATLWMWTGFEHEPDTELLERLAAESQPAPGVRVAFGEPGEGVVGFSATHSEALHAQSVAARCDRAAGQLVGYGKVVVPSLLLNDVERARQFVTRELGALGASDDATLRIRATVKVFLEEGARYSSTARRLGIHQNTVTYRVRQAEELLGRSVVDRRYELETALRLFSLLDR